MLVRAITSKRYVFATIVILLLLGKLFSIPSLINIAIIIAIGGMLLPCREEVRRGGRNGGSGSPLQSRAASRGGTSPGPASSGVQLPSILLPRAQV